MGACVFTWAMCGQLLATLESTVVSLMGEQWSPKMLPSSTAPMDSSSRPSAPSAVPSPRRAASTVTLGSRIAMVLHELPVAKDTDALVKKRISGKISAMSASRPPVAAISAWLVPRSSQTRPITQARMRMPTASSIAEKLPTPADSASRQPSSFWPRASSIATANPAIDANASARALCVLESTVSRR